MSDATFNRSDTLLGVCEALGRDLGFNGQWLRIAFALGLFWSPTVMIATYLLLGVVVWAARALTPAAKTIAVREPAVADNDDENPVMLAEAA